MTDILPYFTYNQASHLKLYLIIIDDYKYDLLAYNEAIC